MCMCGRRNCLRRIVITRNTDGPHQTVHNTMERTRLSTMRGYKRHRESIQVSHPSFFVVFLQHSLAEGPEGITFRNTLVGIGLHEESKRLP